MTSLDLSRLIELLRNHQFVAIQYEADCDGVILYRPNPKADSGPLPCYEPFSYYEFPMSSRIFQDFDELTESLIENNTPSFYFLLQG